jgi:protein gp37
MVAARWYSSKVQWSHYPEDAEPTEAQWPSHVWLGTTVEDEKHADKRIPELLKVPAKVRFLSVEPLLGEVDLEPWVRAGGPQWQCSYCRTYHYEFGDPYGRGDCPRCKEVGALSGSHELNGKGAVSWAIVGGESGKGARPMHPDWVRSIRDQCVAAGVPFFFKQWGEWASVLDRDKDDPDWRHNYTAVKDAYPRKQFLNIDGGQGFHGARVHVVERLGKKNAGRLLDGREWNEVPK